MNAPTPFELISKGNEFETASEEFERNSTRRGGSSRQSRPRQSLPRRGPAPLFRSQQQQGGHADSSSSRRTRRPSQPYGVYAPWVPWGVDPMPFGQGAVYRRCVQSCLAAGGPARAAEPSNALVPEPAATAAPSDGATDISDDSSSSDQEMTMHKPNCQCSQCDPGAKAFEFMNFKPQQAETFEGEGEQYEGEGEYEGAYESQYEGPGEDEGEGEGEGEAESEYEGDFSWQGTGQRESLFNESEEIALAAELLSVTNEAEFEQFLGGLWKGIKRVGSTVAQAAKPFAGVLRSVTKAALPFVGGALGSLIPIPGVGTAVGSALGGALSKALELEYGELELEDKEFEMARSVVRIAGTAAQNFQPPAAGGSMQAAVQSAIANAARQHLHHFQLQGGSPSTTTSGTWVRRGGKLLVLGA